jgi:hypothetical protein
MIDAIVERKDLRDYIVRSLRFFVG